jgi:hypothetical protein
MNFTGRCGHVAVRPANGAASVILAGLCCALIIV